MAVLTFFDEARRGRVLSELYLTTSSVQVIMFGMRLW